MKFVAIGRTKILFRTIQSAIEKGHQLCGVLTCAAAPEYGIDVDDFASLATSVGASFRNDSSINGDGTLAWLAGLGADVAVSVNWPVKIREQARGLFRHGVLNAHAGDLPRFRGNACPNWAILTGESALFATVFEMGPGLDDGPILLKRSMPITDRTTIGDAYAFLEKAVPDMFVESLDGLSNGALRAVPQPEDPNLALRCYPRRPEDSEIDWRDSATRIVRLVRASSEPFAGASTWLQGKRARIWRAEEAGLPHAWHGSPGQVAERDSEGVLVLCGAGAVRLLEVEIEGEGRGAAFVMIRSARARFGLDQSAVLSELMARVSRLEAALDRREEK